MNIDKDKFMEMYNSSTVQAVKQFLEEKERISEMKDRLVKWIKDWFEENGKDCKAVLGVSGGKDSSVVAALCVEALGKERVIGVLMPNGTQKDISDSYKVCEHLGIKYFEVNINDAYVSIYNQISEHRHTEFDTTSNIKVPHKNRFIDYKITDQATFNLPPRLRMATLYMVSQCVNGRVLNTCNLSETLLGWETKWGDAVGDLSPLGKLTVTEVKQIGHELGLPKELVDKTPADGLCGGSDEEKLGVLYKDVDAIIRDGKEADVTIETYNKVHQLVNASRFKRQCLNLPTFDPELPIRIGE